MVELNQGIDLLEGASAVHACGHAWMILSRSTSSTTLTRQVHTGRGPVTLAVAVQDTLQGTYCMSGEAVGRDNVPPRAEARDRGPRYGCAYVQPMAKRRMLTE